MKVASDLRDRIFRVFAVWSFGLGLVEFSFVDDVGLNDDLVYVLESDTVVFLIWPI